MEKLLMIIVGLLMFMVLILIHELGHFSVAKWTGIKVNEFSIGMGPKIKQSKKKETLYTIRALPIGGYVAMEGEDEDSSDPRSFENAKAWQRFLTILAGPLMNFLLAFVILSILFSIRGIPVAKVGEVLDQSPAMEVGLMPEDEILEIDHKEINKFEDISKVLNETKDREVEIKINRQGQEKLLTIKPVKEGNNYLLGFAPKYERHLQSSIKEGFFTVGHLIRELWNGLKLLFTGQVGIDKVSGPVGVIQQMSSQAKAGGLNLMFFFAFISINLGFFNLLPIPALDGSKLLFIIIEKIKGSPVNKKFEQTVTIVGFLLLLALIFVVSMKDIYYIFK